MGGRGSPLVTVTSLLVVVFWYCPDRSAGVPGFRGLPTGHLAKKGLRVRGETRGLRLGQEGGVSPPRTTWLCLHEKAEVPAVLSKDQCARTPMLKAFTKYPAITRWGLEVVRRHGQPPFSLTGAGDLSNSKGSLLPGILTARSKGARNPGSRPPARAAFV